MELLKSPTEYNCKRKSTYISDQEEREILAGNILTIRIFDCLENKEYVLDAKSCVQALLPKLYQSSYGGSTYRCFNYGPVKVKTDVTSKLEEHAEKQQYLTREDVAEKLGVDPVRISELHTFEFLIPVAKIGNRMFYNPEDVKKCQNESRVQTWIKNLRS